MQYFLTSRFDLLCWATAFLMVIFLGVLWGMVGGGGSRSRARSGHSTRSRVKAHCQAHPWPRHCGRAVPHSQAGLYGRGKGCALTGPPVPLAAVILAIGIHIYHSAHPPMVVLGRMPGTSTYR